ncbi:MAG: sprT domain-containing protein [Gammaproteobacteria bacterium]|nr:sprT domain-containing protein [Gammaproteobacteria bacterium]
MNDRTGRNSEPTTEFYRLLSQAFEHFNAGLFGGTLPACLLTVQRETNTMGYFSPERWGNRRGERVHEIAINPAYFASHSLVEVLQTLVHEQCHLWQQVFGQRKSQYGYHNREWSGKMESIGLIPSRTGAPGGKKTGQQMSDYPLSGGPFLKACEDLVAKEFELSWIDRIPASRESSQIRESMELSEVNFSLPSNEEILGAKIEALVPDITPLAIVVEERARKNKTKYNCPSCLNNIWGKPELRIKCLDCNRVFEEHA